MESYEVKSYIPESNNQETATGKARLRNKKRCTGIGGECKVSMARTYCGDGESWWNGVLPTVTRRVE
jgi:hypothetical protein